MALIELGGYGLDQANTITIPPASVDLIVRRNFFDSFSAYQNEFNVFGRMPLNSAGKFNIHRFTNSALIWKPFTACATDPNGIIQMRSQTIEPCKIESMVKYCSDAFDSCFAHLPRYQNGNMDIDGTTYGQILDLAFSEMLRTSGSSLRTLQMLGQFHSFITDQGVFVNPDLPAEEKNGLAQMLDACQGVFALLAEKVDRCEVFGNSEMGNCGWEGDALALFENLKCCAMQKDAAFATMINEGFQLEGVGGPVFVISPAVLSAVIKAYNSQATVIPGVTPIRRFSRERKGRAMVYMFDDIPIVPVSDLGAYDGKLVNASGNTFTTLFAALTVSENLQIGTSFGSLSDPNVGYSVYRDPRPSEKGVVEAVSVGLVGSAIIDPNMIAWDVALIENI